MLRFLFWRLASLLALLLGLTIALWALHGGLGRTLRDGSHERSVWLATSLQATTARVRPAAAHVLVLGRLACGVLLLLGLLSCLLRLHARRRRRYVRLLVDLYRLDTADPAGLTAASAALHATIAVRWPVRLLRGQPSAALEVHCQPAGVGRPARAWLAVCCQAGSEPAVEAALRLAYPNLQLRRAADSLACPPALVRLKKHAAFITRTAIPDPRDRAGAPPPVEALLTAMGSLQGPACLQLALTPAPALFERFAGYRCLFFADIRVAGQSWRECHRLAAVLRARRAENRLVERGTALRHGLGGLYERRLRRGEGNPLPALLHGVFAPDELAELWQAPSIGYSAVPLARQPLPLAPAPPAVHRPEGPGLMRDALGPVSIHPELRCHNVAVTGAAGQGKSSLLVASVVEDLRRDHCAVVVLDAKGEAADAALGVLPPGCPCTFLDTSRHGDAHAEELARTLDFDRVIARGEVVIVRGALGAAGPGETAALMQLLLGMLDAALARRQQLPTRAASTAVALKIDEAPLAVGGNLARTITLRRSAGLETLACWQADAQWGDRAARAQLDTLFAHRIWLATSSSREARDGVALAMAQYSDSVRPDTARLSALGRPDVRTHLPRHHAIVSLTTPQGRQPAFIARTLPMRADPGRLARHLAARPRTGQGRRRALG